MSIRVATHRHPAARLGPLGEPRFRRLWAGQTASAFGDAVVLAALPFAVLQLDGSAAAVGLVFAAYSLPYMALVLVGGVWSDRLPRQRVMLAADAVRAALQAIAGALLLSGRAELWHLVALTVAYAAAGAFFQPAATGLVPQTVTGGRLQQANALLDATRQAVYVVGLALSGVIVAATSPGTAYTIDAASFVVSGFFLARMQIDRVLVERGRFLAELAAGWRAAVSRTWLWLTILWSAAFLFAVVAPVQVLGPVVARESLGGAAAWGAIASAFAAGSLLGGALALRWRPSRPLRAAAGLNLLAAAGPALLASTAPLAAIVPAQLVSGVAGGFFTAIWATTLQSRTAPELISRVGSLNALATAAATTGGYAVAGPLAAALGTGEVLALSAAWAIASTIGALLVPSIRQLRAARVAAART